MGLRVVGMPRDREVLRLEAIRVVRDYLQHEISSVKGGFIPLTIRRVVRFAIRKYGTVPIDTERPELIIAEVIRWICVAFAGAKSSKPASCMILRSAAEKALRWIEEELRRGVVDRFDSMLGAGQ